MSATRSVRSLSSGDFADMSSTSRSSSGGLRHSVSRRSQHNDAMLASPADKRTSSLTPVTAASSDCGVTVSATHATPEFEQQHRRPSNIMLSTWSSRPDSGSRVSAASNGRQRSSSSLFSEDSTDGAGVASNRTSVASNDRSNTSSCDRAPLFRLPFPQPKHVGKRSSSVGPATTGQLLQSPPQTTTSRWIAFGFLLRFDDSVVRTSVFFLADFPRSVPDLWLTCDQFVGKVSAVGQPIRPTQPSIHPGSVNE